MASDGFPAFISAQLHYLINHFPEKVKVEQVLSGGKTYAGGLDRFTLLIPYCLHYVKCLVGEEDLKLRNILSDWNHKDPTKLLALILELRDKYMAYQKKRVGEVDDARLKFEISTFCSREGIEMQTTPGAGKPEEVTFAVPLMDMSINKMVHGCPWRHPQKIYLQVIYPVGKKYASNPSPPRLKLMSTTELRALFSIEDVKLPSWLDVMFMAEYLPRLEEYIQKQVVEAVSLIDIRRRFIESLAPLFGRPLEADPVFCRKATFLASPGSFVFLVHFIISTQFPKQQPALVLQSFQHISPQGMLIKSPLLTEYPWNPRWEASVMAERIFDFLANGALNFKWWLADPRRT